MKTEQDTELLYIAVTTMTLTDALALVVKAAEMAAQPRTTAPRRRRVKRGR